MNTISKFYDLERYQVQITSLSAGQKTPLSVSVPAGLRVRGETYGINANRANAVVKGVIAFSRAQELPFYKMAGESPQDSRVAVAGEYWLECEEDTAKFACILVKQPVNNHIDYNVVVLNRGDTYVLENTADQSKDVFLCEGVCAVNDKSFDATGPHAFNHFEIRSGKRAEFVNNNDTTVCLIEIINLSKDDLHNAAKAIYPDQHQDIGWAVV